MASILIQVTNDMYSIGLDASGDWDNLSVGPDANNLSPVGMNGDGSFSYQQPVAGAMAFSATTNIGEIVNPASVLFLEGSNFSHSCSLTYQPSGSGFIINGSLQNAPKTQAGLSFSQGMLTGNFQLG